MSKPFADQGNFTVFHNDVLDIVQPRLSLSAWAVLTQIIRRTKGWQKESDEISYSQLLSGTGIKGKATIHAAIMELQGFAPVKGKGWAKVPEMPELILLTRNKDDRGRNTATTYRLNLACEIQPEKTT